MCLWWLAAELSTTSSASSLPQPARRSVSPSPSLGRTRTDSPSPSLEGRPGWNPSSVITYPKPDRLGSRGSGPATGNAYKLPHPRSGASSPQLTRTSTPSPTPGMGTAALESSLGMRSAMSPPPPPPPQASYQGQGLPTNQALPSHTKLLRVNKNTAVPYCLLSPSSQVRDA